MNSDRGVLQQKFDFDNEDERTPLAKLLRQESTDPALDDQPALSASSADALMELVVAPRNLERAWRQVKRNRGAPGPDGMTIKQFESWASEIDIGRPSRAFPVTPPGIRVTYHGGSIELCVGRFGYSRKANRIEICVAQCLLDRRMS